MSRDFSNQSGNIVKYGLFTLVCNALLTHLDTLQDAVYADRRLTLDDVWADVESVLRDIHRGNHNLLSSASTLFLDGLRFKRNTQSTINPAMGDALDAVSAEVERQAGDWQYLADVSRWHEAGRNLAQRFYAGCPHEGVQQRLQRSASLAFEWTKPSGQAPFGYRESRIAAAEPTEAGVITVRFSYRDRFANYLAYPFYFMHEYVSHIFAAETKGGLFTDGWLLYAAYAFLKQQDTASLPVPLHGRQVDAFERYILPGLRSRVAIDGYWSAKEFHGWIERQIPGCFRTLMHDLAAGPLEGGVPHAHFLHRLYHHVRYNRGDLLQWLQAAECRAAKVWPSL